LRSIAYRDLSPQIKSGFLRALAKVFADHQNFWEDKRLTISKMDREKLRLFPLRDPGVLPLIGSSSSINPALYSLLVDHLNRGRRVTRMIKWNGQKADGVLPLDARQADEDAVSGFDE
jgi:hypothetical protein